MNKPTQDEIDSSIEVLRWELERLQKDEPYATNDISALEVSINTLECMDD